jgi:hypothetical protein
MKKIIPTSQDEDQERKKKKKKEIQPYSRRFWRMLIPDCHEHI